MSLILAALLAQVGPSVSPGAGGALPQAPLEIPRKKAVDQAPIALPPLAGTQRMSDCLRQAQANPAEALEFAAAWVQTVKGQPAVDPARCRSVALGAIDRWSEAADAFTLARDLEAMRHLRASYGAMAGNAALAAGDPARAEALFAKAHADASIMPPRFAGDIAIDRSRALIALKRESEAATALAEGRTASPENPVGWLLSATLARRQDRLSEAQTFVQRASALDPRDPEIGLEAGVIAVLSGRSEAARRSWQSVVAAAPDSPSAKTAQAYLAQLGPASTTP